MKNIFTLLFFLLFTTLSQAQLDLETFWLRGEAINLKADSENQLHVLEYVIGSNYVNGEWHNNSVFYSKYDERFNRLYSVPILEEVKDTNDFVYLRDLNGSALHIDTEGEIRVILRMQDSVKYDGIWHAPACSQCSDFYYAHFDGNGQQITSSRLDFTSGNSDGLNSSIAFDPDGRLYLAYKSYLSDKEILLPSGDTIQLAPPHRSALIRFDKNMAVDTFTILEGTISEMIQTEKFLYTLKDESMAQYDLNWNLLWEIPFECREISSGMSLNIDQSVSIGGSFSNFFAIEGDTTNSTSSWDNVVFNISKDGVVNWIDFIPGLQDDDDLDIASDRFGNTYYYGDFRGTQQFGDSLYYVGSGLGQVLGKYVNGKPVQSFSLTNSELELSNRTFMTVADDYIYFFIVGRNKINRFCISEADEDCNGFLVDTEEVLAPQSTAQFYPNPTTGLVDIQSDVTLDDLQLFDALGRQLPLQRTGQQISLENLPTGTYYLTYQIRQQRHATPIMKW